MEELANHYRTLHLSPESVNITKVKLAYSTLAKIYHPDKQNGDVTIFNQIKTAYQAIIAHLKGKSNNLTHESLKESYKQFVEQQQESTSDPIYHQQQEHSVSDFDLDKFNRMFIEKQKDKSEIPIDLTDKDFDQRQEEYMKTKHQVENEITQIDRIFVNASSFDRNIFNRQFEHINGNKEQRSKEIAKYHNQEEPLPCLVSASLDKYASIYDEKKCNDGYNINNNYIIAEKDELTNNPIKIDQQLIDQFKYQKDITIQDPVDHNVISKKLNEYKQSSNELKDKIKARLSQKN